MRGVYIDYSSCAMGHTCAVLEPYSCCALGGLGHTGVPDLGLVCNFDVCLLAFTDFQNIELL